MSNSKQSSKGCSIQLFPVFLLLLALKLTGVVQWSWWWITAPLWFSALLFVVFLGCFAVLCSRAGIKL